MLLEIIVRCTALAMKLVKTFQRLHFFLKNYALNTCVELAHGMMTRFTACVLLELAASKPLAAGTLTEALPCIFT